MTFFAGLAIGATVGICAYFFSCWRFKQMFEATPAMEAGACGAGIFAGFDLSFCACRPANLVHLIDKNDRHVDVADLFISDIGGFKQIDLFFHLENMHRIHIFLGGVATAVVALIGLIKFCKRHSSPAISGISLAGPVQIHVHADRRGDPPIILPPPGGDKTA